MLSFIQRVCVCCAFVVSFWGETKAQMRIVSLNPTATHALFLMGGEECLVGCTSYCPIGEKKNIPIVANAIKANVEKIIALKPNVVFASPLSLAKDVELLRETGIRVEMFSTPKTFVEIGKQFERIASFCGKEKGAKEMLSNYTSQVEAIKQSIASERGRKKKVLFQVSSSPIYVALPDSYLGEIITFAGTENIASSKCYAVVGREFVLSQNPDAIFIATIGKEGEKERREWEKFSPMNAVKERNIYLINSNIACLPTPDNYLMTLKEIVILLYPQNKKIEK